MAAASLRLEVSASNIANMSDTGPLPGTNAPNAAGYPAAYEKYSIGACRRNSVEMEPDRIVGSLRPSTGTSLAPAGAIAELFRYASDQVVQS
jgi:hypothetical protein